MFCLCYNIINFQSTPPRRRRRYRGQSAGKAKFFNPRLREGGDSDFFGKDITPHVFSIHASAKEATKSGFGRVGFRNLFNPRLREGGDNATGETYAIMGIFQSTPPRRRRRAMVSGYIRKPRVFNPRLREGGDIFLTFCNHLLYFQSTPPRRRRQCCKRIQGSI